MAWPIAAIALVGQAAALPEPADDQAISKRREWVDRLTREMQVETADMTVKFTRSDKPVLRWAWERNGFTDGQTHVWGTSGRPSAIGGAFLTPTEKTAWYELASLSKQPLVCRHEGQIVWSPPAQDLTWWKVDGAPAVAGTPRERLTQLRSLSQQFRGVAKLGPPRYEEGARWELRLLTTPVHRYVDPKQGIVDGAVFLMVVGTDPQLVLLLEAQKDGDATDWKAAFARLSGFELSALHKDKEVWQSSKVKNAHDLDAAWHLSKPIDVPGLFAEESK